jgi:hypothetical protein
MALRGDLHESLPIARRLAIGTLWARVTRDVWERKSVAMRSRVTRGNVTTYRPEHVVNRADRTPVAVGRDKIRHFDNGGCEAVTNQHPFRAEPLVPVSREWLCKIATVYMRGRGERGRHDSAQTVGPHNFSPDATQLHNTRAIVLWFASQRSTKWRIYPNSNSQDC